MKKIFGIFMTLFLTMTLTACTTTETKKEGPKELGINDTIDVKGVKLKINSVERKSEDCVLKFGEECTSKNLPKKGEFLVFNITITNNSDEDFSSSSILSYELKDKDGNKGEQQIISSYSPTTLDGTILKNDKLTGNIVYDVNKSDSYGFYFRYDLLSKPIKITIKNTDIK